MIGLRFVRRFGLLFVVLMAMAVSAQPSPRAIIVNDNFASATPLPVGKTVKIINPTVATEEPGEPTPCSWTPHNSVWYTFTPTTTGILQLSTAGTQLVAPLWSTGDTAISVYTGAAIEALTEVDCAESISGYQGDVSFLFDAGVTYHIQIISLLGIFDFTPQSFYKLTARLTNLDLSPQNSGFENGAVLTDWTLKHGTGESVACFDGSYPANFGDCAFKFIGSTGKSSRLTQTINVPAGIKLRKGGQIFVHLWYRGMDAANIQNAKVTVTLIYANGTTGKIVFNLSGLLAGGYASTKGAATLTNAALKKIKVDISYKSASGVLMIDNFNMYYTASAMTRETGGVLPAPPPLR